MTTRSFVGMSMAILAICIFFSVMSAVVAYSLAQGKIVQQRTQIRSLNDRMDILCNRNVVTNVTQPDSKTLQFKVSTAKGC